MKRLSVCTDEQNKTIHIFLQEQTTPQRPESTKQCFFCWNISFTKSC